jgi:hypothetical protein
MCKAPIRYFDLSTLKQGVERDMDYKTVMVSLALDRSNDACLAAAGDIAERFGGANDRHRCHGC